MGLSICWFWGFFSRPCRWSIEWALNEHCSGKTKPLNLDSLWFHIQLKNLENYILSYPYSVLPIEIKKQAKTAYSQFRNNPYHPSLQFKRVHSNKPIYSARINIDYRAVGIINDKEIVWFWIGSHKKYEKLLQKH